MYFVGSVLFLFISLSPPNKKVPLYPENSQFSDNQCLSTDSVIIGQFSDSVIAEFMRGPNFSVLQGQKSLDIVENISQLQTIVPTGEMSGSGN